jgi:hypothetical protein
MTYHNQEATIKDGILGAGNPVGNPTTDDT